MFGGEFGAFGSRDRHFFNEDGPAYRRLAEILAVRRQRMGLRRGRQYLRQISGDGVTFGLPELVGGQIRSMIPWSRLFNNEEILLAINTDPDRPLTAWVTVDNELHGEGEVLRRLYATDPDAVPETVAVEARNGKAVRLTVPAGGFVIYE